ncbi:MAG: asparagine--tRNA ligase [Myxococcota bacterium]|nr:asparagine--tRNA ligase [Myxococcota bacterium]
MRPLIRELVASGVVGEAAEAQGWVRSVRHSKGVSFIDLVDGSSMAGIQVVANPELPGYEEVVRKLGTGCAIEVQGALTESPGKGQRVELAATSIDLIGGVEDDYPLQKKRHGFEFLRTIAHLRPRTNTLAAVFRVRNEAAAAIHEFFRENGFVWLHAPIITSSDAEGAGEMFRVSTFEPGSAPKTEAGETDWSQDFFGRETHLTVSGQLEAEIGALSMSRVYTFGPTFRAENSNTARHLAEFWMVEPELAFCDLDGLAELCESFLKHVLGRILERCSEDMDFFDQRIDKGVRARIEHVVSSPFERMTYTEAISRLEQADRDFEFPVSWGVDLQSEHERHLTEEVVGRPLVVTDYPESIKAFYMYRNDDGKTVRALDVLVPRIGEIVGGSQREHREGVLRERMAASDLDPERYWWYLDLRRHGSVPHAGFGLGFERVVQFVTGMANIRDVIPFPRVPGSAEF